MRVRRSRIRVALVVVFALLALNAWAQVVLVPFGRSDDPPLLTALQLLIGAAGGLAAWGGWIGARWAPLAALGYGIVTAVMLLALTPLLDLGEEARGGLWVGAAVILAFTAWSAWYLRRERMRRAASS